MTITIKAVLSIFIAMLFILPAGSVSAGETDYADAINKAGKQLMLSQKIAKAYLYAGHQVQTRRARTQMESSLAEFRKNHNELKQEIADQEIQNMLSFIEFSMEEYSALVSAPYTPENAALVLDIGEALLEGSHEIVKRLENAAKFKIAAIVNISGRQRMLSQRIAKYYIAYKAGFRDHNTERQLNAAVAEFDATLTNLINEERNTEQIQEELAKVANLWGVIKGFYKDVSQGNLPVIVFVTTDKIMTSMDRITGMYAKLVGVKTS